MKKILFAARLYEIELKDRDLLILAKNGGTILTYTLSFAGANFKHFTGVTSSLSANKFYQAALNGRLSTKDFVIETPFLTEKKLKILDSAIKLPQTAKMIGDFHSAGIKIRADIGGGNENYVVAFRKDVHNEKRYVPVSVMDDDTRGVTYPTSPIIAILRKKRGESIYSELTYRSKNINIEQLHIPSDVRDMMSIQI